MNCQALWSEFLTIVTVEVGSRVVETWFKSIALERWDAQEKVIMLRAPNAFVKEWIESNYRSLFVTHLARLLNEKNVRIEFVQTKREQSQYHGQSTKQAASSSPDDGGGSNTLPEARIIAARPVASRPAGLSTHHQFDTFVVGPSNSLAYAAATAVSENPGGLYNPLLICAGSGLGKTHLLQAIGNHIKRVNAKAAIIYQSADRFVNEFVTAVRSDRVSQFEARYKSVDVLLMDDIQLMSNKDATQGMFSHILTSLSSHRKQVVFACDKLPRDIPGLDERMRSRLEGGLVADIQLAPLETRMAILQKKADVHNLCLEDDIARFIAARIHSNIRDLEGGLIRVMAFASLTRQAISMDLVQKVLAHTREPKRVNADMPKILKAVSHYFDYSVPEIRSAKRSKDLALARHAAAYLMKKLTDKSLREIAVFLERKDHSTIIHALDKMEHARMADTSIAGMLEELESLILSTKN